MVTRLFPRLKPATHVCYEFSLANPAFLFCFDDSLFMSAVLLLELWFKDTYSLGYL